MSLKMDQSFLDDQRSNHGIMDEQLIMNRNISNYSWRINSSIKDDDDDDDDDSGSSSPISCSPLQEMSSLLQHLPFKRGLSKHYNGKSQSFTSLTNVSCIEELAKPENPYNKKLKSYGGLLMIPRNNTCSRLISKKTSNRGGSNFSSSLGGKRISTFVNNNNNNNNRPPLHPPHISTSTNSFTSHNPLFA